jgi:hypothetical protein
MALSDKVVLTSGSAGADEASVTRTLEGHGYDLAEPEAPSEPPAPPTAEQKAWAEAQQRYCDQVQAFRETHSDWENTVNKDLPIRPDVMAAVFAHPEGPKMAHFFGKPEGTSSLHALNHLPPENVEQAVDYLGTRLQGIETGRPSLRMRGASIRTYSQGQPEKPRQLEKAELAAKKHAAAGNYQAFKKASRATAQRIARGKLS